MKIHLSLLLLSVVLVERIQAQSIAIPVNNTDEQDTDPQWGVTFNGTNIDFLNNNNTNDDLGYSGDDDDATGGYGYEGLPESAGREDCGNATDIASVPFTDSNSTSGRLGQGGFADARTCTFVGRFTVGAWYVVRGDGSCFNASTAGSMFDTTLSVYTGLDGCTDLQCLDSNDDRQVNSTGYGYGGYNGDEGEGPGGYNGPYGGYNGSYGGYGGDGSDVGGYGGYNGDDAYDGYMSDFSFLTSEVIFQTNTSALYYILVAGLGSETGPYDFSLETVACPVPISNSDCVNATLITTDSYFDTGRIRLSDNRQDFDDATTCRFVQPFTRGEWYQLEGDGRCYNASTFGSNFDTTLSVYEGFDGCQNLLCLRDNDDSGFDLSSLVFFETEPGFQYYILVAGLGGQIGAYDFSLSGGECPPRPANDDCESATSIDSLPFSDSLSLFGASSPIFNSSALSCFNVGTFTRGVFYKLTGDGSCFSILVESDFPSIIAIYEGESCDDLSCRQQSDFYQSGEDTVTFPSVANVTYRVFVGGFEDQVGFVFLEVSNDLCPENDQCENAIPIEIRDLPFIESASNALATSEGFDSPALSCFALEGNSRTLWYSIIGDGSCLSASIAADNFEPLLGLYEGNCDSISCIDQTQFNDRLLSWRSVNNTEYRIVVGGAFGSFNAGDFFFAVTAGYDCPELPENLSCETASEVTAFPFVGTGSTVAASTSNGANSSCFNVNSSSKGVWYSIIGDGACYSASISGLNFDAALALYNGTCNNLTCTDQEDTLFTNTISFETQVDDAYYLFVGGYFGSSGSFTLDIIKGACPSNDACDTAIEIGGVPFIDSSSNLLSSAEGFGGLDQSCFVIFGEAKTNWYELIGDGSCLSASVSGDDFDAVLAVYEGDDCDRLTCVGQTEPGNFRSLLPFRTVVGKTYSIAVAGAFGSSAGDYLLAISEAEDCPVVPENDECAGAFIVSSFPFLASGNTEAASADFLNPFIAGNDELAEEEINDDFVRRLEDSYVSAYASGYGTPTTAPSGTSNCFNIDQSTKGVWYTVEGDGACYSASTLGSNFDTVLGVYTGSGCEELTCIAQNEFFFIAGISWKTEPGELYFILVGGSFGNAGTYFLDIDRGLCPDNDKCESATPIDSLPFIKSASTTLATSVGFDSPALSCKFIDGVAKTVFYSIVGTGSCLTASIAGDEFEFVLALYEGEICDSCLDQTDFNERGLSWRSDLGTRYTLAVAGRFGPQTGEFLLAVASVDCPESPENDECETALIVDTFPFSVTGSTDNASPFLPPDGGYQSDDDSNSPYNDEYGGSGYGGNGGYGYGYQGSNSCFFDSSPVVYYKLAGDGNCYSASTAGSNFDAVLTVFSGNLCKNLVCLGQSRSFQPFGVNWQADLGETYYIVAGGPFGSTGRYSLEIEQGSCVENDQCESATQLDTLPAIVRANNRVATPESPNSPSFNCFLAERLSKTAWFSTVGDGSCLSASVVGDGFEAGVVLFEGEFCNRTTCKEENFQGRFSVVTWQSEVGVTYKLLTGGFFFEQDTRGDYILAITSVDDCFPGNGSPSSSPSPLFSTPPTGNVPSTPPVAFTRPPIFEAPPSPPPSSTRFMFGGVTLNSVADLKEKNEAPAADPMVGTARVPPNAQLPPK